MAKKKTALISKLGSNRLPALLVAAVVVAAGAFGVYQYDSQGVPYSHAASGARQYCLTNTNGCLNAWFGGPWVKTYARGAANNSFTVVGVSGTANFYIQYNGNGECISNGNNSPSDEAAALGLCPNGSYTGAWGSNFQISACGNSAGGGYVFRNNHSGRYLGPSSISNGSQFYLNTPSPYCFLISSPPA